MKLDLAPVLRHVRPFRKIFSSGNAGGIQDMKLSERLVAVFQIGDFIKVRHTHHEESLGKRRRQSIHATRELRTTDTGKSEQLNRILPRPNLFFNLGVRGPVPKLCCHTDSHQIWGSQFFHTPIQIPRSKGIERQ